MFPFHLSECCERHCKRFTTIEGRFHLCSIFFTQGKFKKKNPNIRWFANRHAKDIVKTFLEFRSHTQYIQALKPALSRGWRTRSVEMKTSLSLIIIRSPSFIICSWWSLHSHADHDEDEMLLFLLYLICEVPQPESKWDTVTIIRWPHGEQPYFGAKPLGGGIVAVYVDNWLAQYKTGNEYWCNVIEANHWLTPITWPVFP